MQSMFSQDIYIFATTIFGYPGIITVLNEMMDRSTLTELLRGIHAGDQQALNSAIPLVYGELKKLAAAHLRRESKGPPLNTTALVHEAFLRLVHAHQPSYENRSHFYGVASRLMRQILVDMARARSREKRSAQEVSLTEHSDVTLKSNEAMLLMDTALHKLARTDPLQAQMIEMRYFGGLSAEECSTALGIPAYTVRRELRLARAWLQREMAQ